MTSSNTDTANDSLPTNKPQNDGQSNADHKIDNKGDTAEKTHTENGNDKKGIEEAAEAQTPEGKIKMETVAPDVVVASLETTEDDTQPGNESMNDNNDNAESEFTDTADAFFQKKDKDEASVAADKTVTKQTPSNGTQADKPSTEETLQESLENSNEKGEEDEVKEEKKEAKLESYKQFVAEQFSNKKVDHPEVRVRIEANALPSKMYFVMNILSAIIASYGLVTNSAAVVIGAMLVAMMLGPITGVALAIIDHRMPLLRKSLITVFLGISLVVLVGFMVGWLHKDQPLTVEILSRTQPTSMDLMIALAGGTAGAYAMVSPHLSVAVVGVAVATALVPPLAASGILFANNEIQLGLGALLLALTNIIAIQFTNALVLWLLGFRRLVDDDYKSGTYLTFLRRNAVTLLLLGGLGTYLTINLQTNAKQQVFESSVKETINSYFSDKGNVLTNTQFDKNDNNQVVRAVIRGETTPTFYDVRHIEAMITKDMAENFPDYLPIRLQLRYMPVQVIESHPLIKDKLDETDVTILTE
ncbi:TIGR00341 family protein [Psychrobacter sp. UBA5136]|uniref:TIGR00341 family protein n=1 Tax=Psychrobacter sp. UBA5136 TaxID=1947356 RepID=UPI0025FDFB97|nr:TIGR00341 family protein [Psychrobacter sp. UBA5136]